MRGDAHMTHQFAAYRQGELDSLCGVYAIINALSAVCPELDGDFAAILFRKLIGALSQNVERPMRTLYNGMSQAAVEALLALAQYELDRGLEIRVKVRPLQQLGRRPTLGDLWKRLGGELSRKQVAIVGLSGVHEHWTVAYAVTDKLMRLLDSSERHVLLRSRCTLQPARTRYRISPHAIILIRRTKKKSG